MQMMAGSYSLRMILSSSCCVLIPLQFHDTILEGLNATSLLLKLFVRCGIGICCGLGISNVLLLMEVRFVSFFLYGSLFFRFWIWR